MLLCHPNAGLLWVLTSAEVWCVGPGQWRAKGSSAGCGFVHCEFPFTGKKKRKGKKERSRLWTVHFVVHSEGRAVGVTSARKCPFDLIIYSIIDLFM